jgi:hypothetical protein
MTPIGCSGASGGVEMNPSVVRRLQNLRRDFFEPPGRHDNQEVTDQTVTPAA